MVERRPMGGASYADPLIAAIGALLLIIIISVTAWAVLATRDRALHNGERELSNTALILTRHLDREFEDAV
ncbi:MAG: hypothetical protein MZV49_02770 [Rhodopseudomonas palustris]|nr:hypothetical protein [Rhodopseudomonas palustris]